MAMGCLISLTRSSFMTPTVQHQQWGHRSQKGEPSHNASRDDSRRTIPLDLSTVLFRNCIIFIGQPINSQVAQRVISQLVTLATIDEDADILIYINCPGGSTHSVLAIYDCMSWIKPKVGTVCFGVAASQGALLLAAGEKGKRYAMPNARIMIHQPQSGCEGHVEDVRRQVNEAVQSRHKIDKMYSAFNGQTLKKVQQYTERDRFLSVAELCRLWNSASSMEYSRRSTDIS
ncbi:hypothetical protein MLD38_036149 [Melastoma candidum]|uniref:Uncharacterized protein n=1 Tax=Melastoma candidum TaxID=119954 RepID=A0ACB9LKP2_9MYRT|nr:hypothetical protein MLD38_036149 [Melastoma candidum]